MSAVSDGPGAARPSSVLDQGGGVPRRADLFDEQRSDLGDCDDVERLVRDFYRQAAMDDVLGPVFAAARVDWNAHVATLIDFWSWQLLGEHDYEGNPLRAHEPVHQRTPLTAAHYERWVELFVDTIDSLFEGPTAELAKGRGRKMAAAMERLLSGVPAGGAIEIEPMWRSVDGR